MPVTTWSFTDGFEGWTFEDESAEATANPCPGCSATRSYVSGAIRTTLIVDSLPNVTAQGAHTSPLELNAAIQNGDTIAVDHSATSDAPNNTQITLIATYTDETVESTLVVSSGAGTLTLTLTQNKTLDFIEIKDARSTSGSAVGTTSTRDILEVRLTTATALEPTAGKLRTPKEFIDDAGAGAAGGAGGGAGGNTADISADGLNIYIASFNNLGFPTLIKIGATLSADGSVVFEPGAGGRIGVQTAKFNEDHLWVAGKFDGTNTVEKSENAGSSFTVKDDSIFGTVRTFDVGPDSDTRVIVFDGDNNDIIETTDDGVTWTTINAATSVLLNSIARFDQSVEEIATVNEAGAADGAYYSVNSGANLEDIQAAPYPNADGTKVIAN